MLDMCAVLDRILFDPPNPITQTFSTQPIKNL